ncbi:MAG: C25 family cysteine peptidase [bacterium]|nr:C25 family cysteine peptidase [bacterium]
MQAYVQTKGTLFVVLGGDDTIVPDRNTQVSIGTYNEPAMPTDLYYSGLDGTWDDWNTNNIFGEADVNGINDHDEGDLAPDVIVGRIPGRSAAQARAYIDKVCAFEASPPSAAALRMLSGGVTLWDAYSGSDRPADPLNDGLSQFQAHAPVTDAEMWGRRLYRDAIQPFWQAAPPRFFFDSITSWDSGTAGSYPLSKANFTARLNEGWQLCSFDTHGNPGGWSLEADWFGTADAAALTNAPRLIYTMACDTASFDTDEPCLSEAFLRNPYGAVAYIGCSRYGWGGPDDPPASPVTFGGTSSAYEMEFHRQLFAVRRATLGEAFAWHKAAKAAACGDNYAYRWVQFGLNFQGDPALHLPLDFGVHFDGLDPATPLDASLEPGSQTPLAFWLKNEDLVTHAATVTLATSSAAITCAPATLVFSALAGGARVSNAVPVTLSVAADCAAGAYQLAFVCAGGGGTRTTTLALAVAPQPAAILTDTNIVLVCPPGACVTAMLAIANAGGAPLAWQCAAGSNFLWRDSRMPGGPAFAWIPVAPGATHVVVGDDDVAAPIALPIPFYFYGQRCTNVYIGSNGALGFAPGFLDGNNQALPCLPHNGFGPLLAPFWDDLDPGSAGAIWLQSSSTQLVVSYVGVPRLDYAAQQQTFQAVLEGDGRMRLQYLDLRGNLSNATIGVQEAHAGRTLQMAYNAPFLANNLAVEIAPPALPAWLALAQTCGEIAAQTNTQLNLIADANAMTSDYARTTLYLWHNDARAARCTPISVTVVLPEPAALVGFGWLMACRCIRRRAMTGN